MASQSILRNSVKSPARVLIRPSTRSILKRPAPLPLSPNPFPYAASFSIEVTSSKLSPHVHFPPSPAMAATFSAFSPSTYDRGAIIMSPSSLDVSSWGSHINSPSGHFFKLSDPPKAKNMSESTRMLEVPQFEDPRSPKPYRASTQPPTMLVVPQFEDPRSPKPYKAPGHVRFEELSARAPRGARGLEELGKALSSYPRSPYPSAPVSPAEEMEVGSEEDARGRWPSRNASLKAPSKPARARSLETKPKRRPANAATATRPPSPHTKVLLTPIQESPRITVTRPTPAPLNLSTHSPSPASVSTRLSQAFWQSVSLHEGPEDCLSPGYPTSAVEDTLASPGAPPILFGKADGSLWSPGLPRKNDHRAGATVSLLSPRPMMKRSLVASPSPNDPFAAFPSFTVAIMQGMDGAIAYPAPAVMGRE